MLRESVFLKNMKKLFAIQRVRAAERALVEHLASVIPPLQAVLAESRQDMTDGETLPHLVMADYERWLETAIVTEGAEMGYAHQLLGELEIAIVATPRVEEIIAVSFAEMFPPKTTTVGGQIYAALGPRLRSVADSL